MEGGRVSGLYTQAEPLEGRAVKDAELTVQPAMQGEPQADTPPAAVAGATPALHQSRSRAPMVSEDDDPVGLPTPVNVLALPARGTRERESVGTVSSGRGGRPEP
jgi:hypothetical protein